MVIGIHMLFFRNVYFLEWPVHCYLDYSTFLATLKRNTWLTLTVSETNKETKIQKDFSGLAFSKSIKTKQMKKTHSFRCKKSGFRNDTQTDGEIMAHFH